MNLEQYPDIFEYPDKLEFRFFSEGPKGKIEKVVQFHEIGDTKIFNLTFGNPQEDGSIDDESITNNKDRDKILSTIAGIVQGFISHNPDSSVFFCGSTKSRTRLFRIALNANIERIRRDYKVFGIIKVGDKFIKMNFEKHGNYFGFIITKK